MTGSMFEYWVHVRRDSAVAELLLASSILKDFAAFEASYHNWREPERAPH